MPLLKSRRRKPTGIKGTGIKYSISVKVARPGTAYWRRIGYANEFITEQGVPAIACTIDAAPLNWDGEFFLFQKEGFEEYDDA